MNFLFLVLEFIVRFWIIIIIPVLILFVWSLLNIQCNIKVLKYIFKLSEKSKIKDILQIFTIIFLAVVAVLIMILQLLLVFPLPSHSCAPCFGGECRRALRMEMSALNHAVTLEKALENKVSYENANDFGLMLIKRFSILEIYNVKNVDIKNAYKIKTLNKKKIKNYNLDEYQNMPILVNQNGSVFMISKFEQGCKNVDLDNPDNCSCLIDVDFNGIEREPNKKTDFNPRRIRNDRYTFVIDGNEDKIVPLSIYRSYINGEEYLGAENGRK